MKPNILFLFSDQQRWDTVSCYGEPLLPDLTPNLDRMAAEGVRFHQAFTCQPVCGPARSCLQTGLYASQTRCTTNGIALSPDADTLATHMHDAGYETAYIGKWHLASNTAGKFRDTSDFSDFHIKPVPPELRGGYRDHWVAADILEFTSHGYEGYMFDKDMNRVDFEGYRVDCTANFVLDYLRDYATRKSERPFFLFASFIEPHHQNDLNRFVGPIGSKQRFADYRVPGDLDGTGGDWRLHMPDYLGCCWSLDRNVGRIRDQLELLGLAKNTVVVYTSDHGSHFCTRNSEYKRACHDNCLRVPLIINGPGFRGGQVVDELVSLIDLPPTIVEAGGATPMANMQGRALQPLTAGSRADWPDFVFAEITESHCGRCIRTRRWKYSVRAPDPREAHAGADLYVEDFLYDLEQDPYERNNLVADPALAEVRAELAGRLLDKIEQVEGARPSLQPAT